MSTPEGRLTAAVIRELRARKKNGEPVAWLKIKGGPMQARGWPDLLVIYRGRVLFVELKAEGNEPTLLQRARIEEIRTAGGEAHVCRTMPDVRRVLDFNERREP